MQIHEIIKSIVRIADAHKNDCTMEEIVSLRDAVDILRKVEKLIEANKAYEELLKG